MNKLVRLLLLLALLVILNGFNQIEPIKGGNVAEFVSTVSKHELGRHDRIKEFVDSSSSSGDFDDSYEDELDSLSTGPNGTNQTDDLRDVYFYASDKNIKTNLNKQRSKQRLQSNESPDAEDFLLEEEDVEYDDVKKAELFRLHLDVNFWRDLFLILGGIITFIGTMLNSICIIIFYRSKLFRNSSFPFYVYLIAIVDTLNLFIRYLVPQTAEKIVRSKLKSQYNVQDTDTGSNFDEYTPQIVSDYNCNIFVYLYNSLTLISVWLMVAISFERWLATKFKFQTKFMLQMRAVLILTFIIVAVLLFNMFDLAPSFYTPQWYSNITLLCERVDTISDFNNSTHIYKQIGWITFNTNIYSFVRTIIQTVVPFVAVLLFNTLIIYNYKKIKLTALGNVHRNKSTSCVSVMSGGSFSAFSHLAGGGSGYNGIHSCAGSMKHRSSSGGALSNFRSRRRRSKTNMPTSGTANNLTVNNLKVQQSPSSNVIMFSNNSSRSPSPITPTSLVAALNLAAEKNPANSRITPQTVTTAATTPTADLGISGSGSSVCCASSLSDNRSNSNSRCSPNKYFGGGGANLNVAGINGHQYSSSYLMPPTPLSSFQQQRLEQQLSLMNHNNSESINPSIETRNNSSANLSVATITATSNITTTTTSHAKPGNEGGKNSHEGPRLKRNLNNSLSTIIRKVSRSSRSGKHDQQTQLSKLQDIKNVSGTNLTVATSNSRVSFKRRASKIKLNRETDIMLIILSFSILLSQLPCTIAWYLIYYCNILYDIHNLMTRARTPILLYIIRLLEMIYFSLNFIFYITLSPSLRKEIKENCRSKRLSRNPIIKLLCASSFFSSNPSKSQALNGANMNNHHSSQKARLYQNQLDSSSMIKNNLDKSNGFHLMNTPSSAASSANNLRECASATAIVISSTGGGSSTGDADSTSYYYKLPSVSSSNQNEKRNLSGLSLNLNGTDKSGGNHLNEPMSKKQRMRLNSSSGEYHFFIEKLRSLSPMHNNKSSVSANTLSNCATPTTPNQPDFNDFELKSSSRYDESANQNEDELSNCPGRSARREKPGAFKKLFNFVIRKSKRQSSKDCQGGSLKKNNMTAATKNANIQIVIDNHFDNEEEEQLEIEEDLIVDTSENDLIDEFRIVDTTKQGVTNCYLSNRNSRLTAYQQQKRPSQIAADGNRLTIYNNPMSASLNKNSSSPSFLTSFNEQANAQLLPLSASSSTTSSTSTQKKELSLEEPVQESDECRLEQDQVDQTDDRFASSPKKFSFY